MNEIGFVWDPYGDAWRRWFKELEAYKQENAWKLRFEELKAYKQENGDCNVPAREGKLGQWVADQRRFHKAGKLSKERIVALKDIGFEWAVRVARP